MHNKEQNSKSLNWYKHLVDICYEGSVEDLKFFLNKNPQVDLTYKDGGLIGAASTGNLEIVRYLLSSPELIHHVNIHADNDMALVCSANEGHIQVLDYLLFSPEIKEHADLHAQNDGVFEWSMKIFQSSSEHDTTRSYVYKLIEHLIINIGLEKGIYIKKYLENNPCEEVESLFKKRDEVEKLEKELKFKKDKQNSQKTKI